MAGGRRALLHTFSSQYSTMIIQFVVVIVISRLLTPAEIGIFSVGAAFVALGQLLRDFGTGQYIVQEKELTTDRIRAAFTVTLFLGWSISAIVFLLSGVAADFYEEPGLTDILSVLAVNFLLLPFGTITVAYLRRQMDFKPAAIARVGSTFVSGIVSITLAFNGFSYMSLAWGGLAGSIATISIVSIFRPRGLPWLPGFKEVKRVIGFGSKVSGINILDEIAALTPELVLGKTQGFHEVGLFSRAKGTVTIFSRMVLIGVRPVVGSLFAKKHREQEELLEPYLFGVTCMTGLAWAFYANLAVLAPEFVLSLYGGQWTSIAPLVQIWCLSGIVYHLTSLMDQVLVGTGNVDRLFRVSMILQPLRIAALVASAFISLEAVMVVVLLTPVVRHFLIWGDVKQVTGAIGRDYGRILWVSGIPAFCSATAAFFVSWGMTRSGVESPIVVLLCAAAAAGATWLLPLYYFKHALWGEVVRINGNFLARMKK